MRRGTVNPYLLTDLNNYEEVLKFVAVWARLYLANLFGFLG
jgi:hypothetical protein